MDFQIVSLISNGILIPLVIYGIRKFKKSTELQVNTARDMSDMKKYIVAICKELKIYCTLDEK